MSDEFIELRKPTNEERQLIAALVAKAVDLTLPAGWIENLRVQSMVDGGMGSLRLISSGSTIGAKSFGKKASELIFEDEDGVKVIASLNLDLSGWPMELDIWKSDFNPLIRLPQINS